VRRGNLGPKTYLIFAGWMFLCVVITFFCLPETKGRSPAELDAMFAARVPARKFKSEFDACSSFITRTKALMSCVSDPNRLSLQYQY
jgi:hypothetical protein